jgi:hypothetical protein
LSAAIPNSSDLTLALGFTSFKPTYENSEIASLSRPFCVSPAMSTGLSGDPTMPLVAKQALVCWFAALALIVAALFAFVGAPGSPDGAGEAIGRVFANTGIAALICWLLARRKMPPWSWIRFALIYLALVIVLAVVANVGRAHATEAMSSDSVSARP